MTQPGLNYPAEGIKQIYLPCPFEFGVMLLKKQHKAKEMQVYEEVYCVNDK